MVDHINPIGSLASGSVKAPLPASSLRSAQDTPQPAQAGVSKTADAAARLTAQGATSAKTNEIDPNTLTGYLQQSNSNLAFKIDKSTGIPFFQVVDANSGQVIRQVPSADVLAMAQKLQTLSSHRDTSGILLDKEG